METLNYQTSDGVLFYNESDAKNHARGLGDKMVKPVADTVATSSTIEEIEVTTPTKKRSKKNE